MGEIRHLVACPCDQVPPVFEFGVQFALECPENDATAAPMSRY
jgi:hypothetical protein